MRDRLSWRVGLFAQGVATMEGGTGAQAVLFLDHAILDLPLLFNLCLATIIKTGRCYGYALDRPADKGLGAGEPSPWRSPHERETHRPDISFARSKNC